MIGIPRRFGVGDGYLKHLVTVHLGHLDISNTRSKGLVYNFSSA